MFDVKVSELRDAIIELHARGDTISLQRAWEMLTGEDCASKNFSAVNRWLLAKFFGWRYYARACIQPSDFLDSFNPPLWRAIARMGRDEDSVVLSIREYSGIPPNGVVYELYVHVLKTIELESGDVIMPNPK